VQKVGAFLFPNVAALGERGVPGSALDNTIGGLKAAYNIAQGLAIATNVSLTVQSALGHGPDELEIADNQLAGAAIVEGVSAVLGVVAVERSLAARANSFSIDIEMELNQRRVLPKRLPRPKPRSVSTVLLSLRSAFQVAHVLWHVAALWKMSSKW
jgi:hypothetical protein